MLMEDSSTARAYSLSAPYVPDASVFALSGAMLKYVHQWRMSSPSADI